MAIDMLDQIGKYIGILLFNIYQILDINCYVIGGDPCYSPIVYEPNAKQSPVVC